MFQYPKVRLKVLLNPSPRYPKKCGFNTRRCDWRKWQTRLYLFMPKSFNTRRCDWRPALPACPCSLVSVSIPEGAIEGSPPRRRAGFAELFQYPKVRLKDKVYIEPFFGGGGFNTRRCDWRGGCGGCWVLFCFVSIPEGAIEGPIL